jgi:predicted transcriptional regulator
MITSEKRLRELAGKLNNKNKKVVSDAINSVRNEDPFKGAISLLAEVYDSSEDLLIHDYIRNFFNDLKEQSASVHTT